MTRYIVCIAVIISAAIGVSCSSRDYEYYLDKDTTHPDVYTIKITLTSDGSCDFSINGDRASTYQTFVWTEPEVLQEVKGGSNGSGLCLRDSSKPSSSSDTNPRLFLDIYWPEDIILGISGSDVVLDVLPADLLYPGYNPPGVYFDISQPQPVGKIAEMSKNTSIRSIKGTAVWSLSDKGVATMEVEAQGYAFEYFI